MKSYLLFLGILVICTSNSVSAGDPPKEWLEIKKQREKVLAKPVKDFVHMNSETQYGNLVF